MGLVYLLLEWFLIGTGVCAVLFVSAILIAAAFRNQEAEERCILDLLAEHGEMYGIELVRHSNGVLKLGAVHVTLRDMEDRGLLVCRKGPPVAERNGCPRYYYRINWGPHGRA